ncbi:MULTISPECIES: exopolyphosphatase [unclassified Actinobaculum]|uniref:Ppx/GppA phosphatase family protein n=1 Tax=unclassified Actinobaculum TaxID=2609299 RepID=UPI000D529BEE|nr:MULTISPECIES: exopolyphosphatase [unclassified Actinobaculum]AWE43386.1 exopolyphosphatase [Actinobaculum sp. 313]RTE50247.1 exopolyphosphatase [Actinobaculum sp. 352]
MRVAGIDCGTNSIRLLIADVPGARAPLDDVVRRMDVVRLGQGVDQAGEFAADALERTFAQVEEYAQLCREHGVESIRFAATSAARDARNRDVFLSGVRARMGVPAQVLNGEAEARASFRGAASVLSNGAASGATSVLSEGTAPGAAATSSAMPPSAALPRSDVAGAGALAASPLLAVDLGGGSTEIVLGSLVGGVISEFSMDVGCVRMHERHLHDDPPTSEQIAAARADVNAALDAAERVVDFGASHALVGLAGTVTTLTAKSLGLEAYDPSRIHGSRLTPSEVIATCEWFLAAPRSTRAALGFMHPGRVDVIAAGALVWEETVKRIAQRMAEGGHALEAVVTSEHDILDGVALWAAEEVQAPQW